MPTFYKYLHGRIASNVVIIEFRTQIFGRVVQSCHILQIQCGVYMPQIRSYYFDLIPVGYFFRTSWIHVNSEPTNISTTLRMTRDPDRIHIIQRSLHTDRVQFYLRHVMTEPWNTISTEYINTRERPTFWVLALRQNTNKKKCIPLIRCLVQNSKHFGEIRRRVEKNIVTVVRTKMLSTKL